MLKSLPGSCSPWASPIVMVRKPNGKWRMCIDYRKLNAVTVADVYPLPPIDQMLYNMRSAKDLQCISSNRGC